MIRLVELGLTMHDELSEEPPRANVYCMIAFFSFQKKKLFYDVFHSRFAKSLLSLLAPANLLLMEVKVRIRLQN
jgi:hypothetical protein